MVTVFTTHTIPGCLMCVHAVGVLEQLEENYGESWESGYQIDSDIYIDDVMHSATLVIDEDE